MFSALAVMLHSLFTNLFLNMKYAVFKNLLIGADYIHANSIIYYLIAKEKMCHS